MWMKTDDGTFFNTDLVSYLFVGFDPSVPKNKGSWAVSSNQIWLWHCESEEKANEKLLEIISELTK